MKILFAVNNEGITTSIISKYQQKYKEIVTSKSVYYFNAIIKELKSDKTYDSIVISEDLEPMSNNSFDAIDKFLIDKLDRISDEASKLTGEDIPIIFICSDRRTKSDQLLKKFFSMGIYNALVENDRSLDKVCELMYKPRNKKSAKQYYMIEDDDSIDYEPTNEELVSEEQLRSILSYYKKIGNDERKCVQAFESISKQYNNTQLRLIVKVLPIEVKAILETNSPIYQRLMENGTVLSNGRYSPYKKHTARKPEKLDFVEKKLSSNKATKPVVIPSNIDISRDNSKKISNPNNLGNLNIQKQNANYYGNQNRRPVQNNNIQRSQQYPQYNPYGNQYNAPYSNGIQPPSSPMYQQQYRIPQQGQAQSPQYQSKYGPVYPYNPYSPNSNYNNMRNNQVQNFVTPMRNGQNMRNNQFNSADNGIRNDINNRNNIVATTNTTNRSGMQTNNEINTNNENNQTEANSKPSVQQAETATPVKKRRGRPKKNSDDNQDVSKNESSDEIIKRGRGRPKKSADNDESIENNEANIFNDTNEVEKTEASFEKTKNDSNAVTMTMDDDTLGENYANNNVEVNDTLNQTEDNVNDEDSRDIDLFNLSINNPENEIDDISDDIDDVNSNTVTFNTDNIEDDNNDTIQQNTNDINDEELIQKDDIKTDIESDNFVVAGNGKIVSFVGTTKNGTSFIVNNLALMLADEGVNVAIIDLTKNKNSYYMFTNNESSKIKIAEKSLKKLSQGTVDGLKIKNNLQLFTSLPDDETNETLSEKNILNTASKKFDLIMLDCDISTSPIYFNKSDEIYLIQSMDAFTIQPLTKFLSDIKNLIDFRKTHIVINKYVKLKKLNYKMVIAGMSKYNDPSMALQRDLFDPKKISYDIIPFDVQTYAAYLDAIALCNININGFSNDVKDKLDELKSRVYPLIEEPISKKSNKLEQKSNFVEYGKEKRKSNSSYNDGTTNTPIEQLEKNVSSNVSTNNKDSTFSSDINNTLNKMRNNKF